MVIRSPRSRRRSAILPATLPTGDLPGLDPAWSRLIKVIDANGITRTFHLLDSGDTIGSRGTLLCVHGNPTWSYLWRALVAAPPTGWRVIAVDQLGMGFSDRIGEVRRLSQRVDDLDRLVSALDIQGPVITVAHDWGGPISLGWALAHPDQLKAVILTNTAVHQPAGSPVPALIKAARTPVMLDAVCEQTQTFIRGATAISRPALPKSVRDAFAAPYTTAARRSAVADFVADIPLEADHPSMPALHSIAEGVKELAVPVLLLWGPVDPVFSDRYLRDLMERIPHADVHRYERASHLVTEDAPALFDDVRAWVGRLGSTVVAAVATPTDADRRPLGAALSDRANDPATSAEPAVIELANGGRSVTWGHLAQVVDNLAAGLLEAGVRPGDRVGLLVPPGADLTAAVYACWRIGAVIVAADAGLGARGLARALRGAWPKHLIAIEQGLVAAKALRIGGRRIAAGSMSLRRAKWLGADDTMMSLTTRGRGRLLPPYPDAAAEAAVLFTSGATGPAKGVVYRHQQIEANRDALLDLYAITATDSLVAAFAPFALYGPALGIASATPDIDVTKPGTLDAVQLAKAVRAVRATLIWASPAALQNVVATADDLDSTARGDLQSVRLLMSAGAPVPAGLLHQVLDLLPSASAHTPYGMTEVLPVADIDLVELDQLDATDNGVCVGRPVRGARVQISAFDLAGKVTALPDDAPDVSGEILVSAPWAKDRYDRLAATEARSARNPGWHRTGDVGHLDDDGRLWVEGRLSHVVTTADGPITPVGIEQTIARMSGVVAAACVGVGPAGAQVVVIVIVPDATPRRRDVLADPALTARIRAAIDVPVAAVLVRSKLPVDVRHNSKVDRTALSGWATERLS